jgi:hypothetical protein
MPNMMSTTRVMMDAKSTAAADHRTEPQDVGMGQQLPTPKAKSQSTSKVSKYKHGKTGPSTDPNKDVSKARQTQKWNPSGPLGG